MREDVNVELVELAAAALGDLLDQVVFVGGATIDRWQRHAVEHAVERKLPSGVVVRLVPPPYLLATKIEAFKSRGKGDFLGSRDFGDVIVLIDGREELIAEVATAPDDVRRYLAQELTLLRDDPYFESGVSGALPPDRASQLRSQLVVGPRIEAIIEARRP